PFAVLQYLVEHPGRLVTHNELMSAIWPDTYVQQEVLRRYILEIRRVLGDDVEKPRFVETLPKRGYQFIAPITEQSAETVSGSISLSPPKLVGRESAMTQLNGCLHRALGGKRQISFVSGEAGVGKTSLVDAFQQLAGIVPAVRVARGQSVEGFGGKEAYYPIFEALGQLARGENGPELFATLSRHAPTWIMQFPALVRPEQYAELQREVLGATKERMVRELCEALEIISRENGLVLILEDLHWVDHSTVDLISAVARRREPAKLFVLGTFRPADLILFNSPFKTLKQDLLLHRLCSEISLERLSQSDVAEYLAAAFGDTDLPPTFASIIYRHSDGNPLFMTAMLDHLSQQGVLSQLDGRWRITVPLDQIDPGVPETLKQMLELQLQHLSQEEQQLLKCASVAGEHFTAWSVSVMRSANPADVETQCDALAERQQFVRRTDSLELSNAVLTSEYQFRHSLYREVLYRHLNPTQRVKFHRLLAEGLESLRTSTESEAASEIALHFEEGRQYEQAIRYLIVAAENATHRYAHPESIAALEHARELLPKISRENAPALDVQILERIGDSQYALGDMERSAATYHIMATRAAEAGLLTAQANALMRLAHSAEAIPFFVKAIELDPKFASAYVSLSRIYSNLGEVERAQAYAKLAYDLRDTVSERERLSIIYQYQFEVTGDQVRAAETLEVWKRSFPEEFQPVNSLAFMHNVLGDFERAMIEGQEALRRNPSHGFPYSNLAHAHRGLGRFNESQMIAEQAVARNIETLPTRRLLYQLAILSGDQDAAERHVEWCRDRPREFEMVAARAQVSAYTGKLGEARKLFEETAQMAERRNLADVGTNHLSWATWVEMAFGNASQALKGARRVLARNPSYDSRLRAALTLSATGFADEAETIVDELVGANPEHTIINSVLAPIVRGGIALARTQPAAAIKHLQVVEPYELGFCAILAPIYLRAQSYLSMGSPLLAAKEFQRILDHRGSEPFSPFCAVSLLGLGRTNAMSGNTTVGLRAYEQFLSNWSDADSDVPILIEARNEYDQLNRSA
ncbi:MAG TPA: AAA family ATPase, partial [Pyrinomonadaceae bacterium]